MSSVISDLRFIQLLFDNIDKLWKCRFHEVSTVLIFVQLGLETCGNTFLAFISITSLNILVCDNVVTDTVPILSPETILEIVTDILMPRYIVIRDRTMVLIRGSDP